MANYKQVGYGSQGSEVTELQKLLNNNGYKLTVDGIFGSKTQSAVEDYQQKNKLAVDGIVGKNTWGALTKASTPAATTTTKTTPTTKQWSYNDFKPSDSTTTADQKRQEVAGKKPGDFSYGEYQKSDTVLQAEALLQQQLASQPGAYQSQWQSQLNDIFGRIMNREDFSYDLNKDALYQQLRDQYVLQGKMASMDTMGQAQAMTGGYGNSYAQSVGQQAYQGYLQQLNDRVPELYGMALDQYNQEGQALYNQAALMADRENQDYGRYRDQLSDYYAQLDRMTEDARYQGEQDYGRYLDGYNVAYGQYRDQMSDWQQAQARADDDYWKQYERDYGQYADGRDFSYGQFIDERNLTYQKERDQVSDNQWQKEFDESKRQYDQQYALAAGKTGSPSSSGGSGGSGGSDGGNGGTDGGNGGNGYDNEGLSAEKIKNIQRSLGITVDGKWGPESQKAAGGLGAKAAYDAWNKGKLGKPVGTAAEFQKQGEGNTGSGDGFTGSTYSDAAAYIKSKGGTASGLMTQSEWQRHRNSYLRTGQSNAEGANYSSYAEYLKDYVEYATQ